MRKKICALLVVLGAFGTVAASATPVDAQTGPQGVRWGQRYRSVSFRTPIGSCYDIRVNGGTWADVPYGQYREPFQAWFTCGNGNKTFAADLYTHAETGFDGYGWAEYRLEVRVDTPAGSTYCGRVTAWSWLNRYINGHETFVWSQALATSRRGPNSSDSEGYVRLNCGSHGYISVRLALEEGRGTF